MVNGLDINDIMQWFADRIREAEATENKTNKLTSVEMLSILQFVVIDIHRIADALTTMADLSRHSEAKAKDPLARL
jgi:hypothetical protein